jgi:hypothetical protein
MERTSVIADSFDHEFAAIRSTVALTLPAGGSYTTSAAASHARVRHLESSLHPALAAN